MGNPLETYGHGPTCPKTVQKLRTARSVFYNRCNLSGLKSSFFSHKIDQCVQELRCLYCTNFIRSVRHDDVTETIDFSVSHGTVRRNLSSQESMTGLSFQKTETMNLISCSRNFYREKSLTTTEKGTNKIAHLYIPP